jgi:hypothetical protein
MGKKARVSSFSDYFTLQLRYQGKNVAKNHDSHRAGVAFFHSIRLTPKTAMPQLFVLVDFESTMIGGL